MDFLNQAIELAATESIEWRAFYVSQKISKTTAEDFFQGTSGGAQIQEIGLPWNTLFYKSICRSTLR